MRCVVVCVMMLSCGTVLSQSAPPVKMGLWEKHMVMDRGDGKPDTLNSRSCVTPQTWQEMANQAQKPRPNCTNNVVKTGNGFAFDGTCTTAHTSMTIHGKSTIQDSEHIVSESHSTMTINGKTHDVNVQSTSRWVSASCGTVKPDDPEVE